MDCPVAFVVLRMTEEVKGRAPMNLTMLTPEMSLEVRTTLASGVGSCAWSKGAFSFGIRSSSDSLALIH